MPINLADLKKDRRMLELKYADQSFIVTYKPAEITPEREDDMLGAGNLWDVCEFLALILHSWEILDKPDGKPLEITADVIYGLPDELVTTIIDGVIEDKSGGEDTQKNSGDGSFTRDRSARRRRGTR